MIGGTPSSIPCQFLVPVWPRQRSTVRRAGRTGIVGSSSVHRTATGFACNGAKREIGSAVAAPASASTAAARSDSPTAKHSHCNDFCPCSVTTVVSGCCYSSTWVAARKSFARGSSPAYSSSSLSPLPEYLYLTRVNHLEDFVLQRAEFK